MTEIIVPFDPATNSIVAGLDKVISSDGLSPAYEDARKELLDRFIQERTGLENDTVLLALLERASYLQARLKQREAIGAYSSEQNYTMANKTLTDTLNSIKKIDKEKLDLETERKDFMMRIASIVNEAISDLDVEVQQSIMQALRKGFREEGL